MSDHIWGVTIGTLQSFHRFPRHYPRTPGGGVSQVELVLHVKYWEQERDEVITMIPMMQASKPIQGVLRIAGIESPTPSPQRLIL